MLQMQEKKEITQISEEKQPEKLTVKKVLKRVAEVPSGGIFYPKNYEIYFTPMTVREAELLNESEVSTQIFFNTVLESITTVGMDKNDITYPDFIYIALMRKLYSQESILGTTTWYCEECGSKNVTDFDFSEISFSEPKERRTPAKCVIGEYAVDITPLTIGGALALYETESVSNVDTMAHCVRAIYEAKSDSNGGYIFNELPYSLELAQQIIDSAYGEEIDMLKEIDDMYFHFIEDMKFTCKGCKHEQSINLGSPEALVFPRCGHTSAVGHKIFFS